MVVQVEQDESYSNFSFAIMAIFATYVFEISTCVGKQREKLHKSDYWSKDDDRLQQALKGVRKASIIAVSVSTAVIIASAIIIAIPSDALEQRMKYILEGLSLLFSAVVLARLSFQVAIWTGLYYKVWRESEEETACTLKEVKFKARWAYYRIFARYGFFLMPFYQGVTAATIPVSMIVGVVVGLMVDFGVYYARRSEKHGKLITISIISILVIASSIIMADGTYFVAKVWGQVENAREYVWMLSVLVICIVVESLLHILRWRISRKKFEKQETDEASPLKSSTANRPRMATSLIAEALMQNRSDQTSPRDDEDETDKDGKITPLNGISKDPDPEQPGHQDTDSGSHENEGDVEKDGKVNDDTKKPDSEQPDPEEPDPELPNVEADANSQDMSEVHEDNSDEQETDYDESPPSYKQMFCAYWTCCGCVRGDDRSRSEKAFSFLHWTVWYVLVFFSLYLVIVNIGSTAQQEYAREKLPFVQNALYDFIDEGPVCAFDNKGADSNITTFEDKEAAHAEGFLVLHCGACAACSDWDNLRQEYVTREYLAKESARCAKKSLFGGRQAVLDCLKLPPISFEGKCAECWVDDILCTKGFCSFIFLQSVIIVTAGNFQVTEDTITSAACEEAHCEAANPGDFVYCSGATRRRMNVTSTISRPGAQRCGIVDVDWAELFPE